MDAGAAAGAAELAADRANLARYNEALYSLASEAVDRANTDAQKVRQASAAIAVLYTGALGLAFSVTDNPLPLRAIAAPIFLGLALVLAAAYTEYLAPETEMLVASPPVGGLEPRSIQRLNMFVKLSSQATLRRGYALRASVIALAVALILIVLPFISFGSTVTSSQVDWPPVPIGDSTELARIRYQAEVDEAAAQRRDPTPVTDEVADWMILLWAVVLGGLLVFVGAAVHGTAKSPRVNSHV